MSVPPSFLSDAAGGSEDRTSWRPPDHLLHTLDLVASDLVNVVEGRSGFAWRVRFGTQHAVLRYSPSADEHTSRMAALQAAGEAGLPVPDVRGQVVDETGGLLVLDWLPGKPMAAFLQQHPREATAAGYRFGGLQRELHGVVAPREVLPVADAPEPGGRSDALVHLDWHPYNVLVDDDGEITGVIDWDNARSGEPALDVARTWAMLTADPALDEHPPELRPILERFTAAWAAGYRTTEDAIHDRHRRWAARMMLTEWQDRPRRDEALAPLRRIADGD